jgi:hypothetical protein
MKKEFFVVLIASIVLGMVGLAQAVDLGGLKSKVSPPANMAPAQDPILAQDALVKSYVGSAQQISQAQIHFARALGLKDEAAALKTETKALGSGSVSASSIKKQQARSKALDEKIAEKMASGSKLTVDGRKMFASGLLPYSAGLAEGAGMSLAAKNFGESVDSYVRSSSPMEKMRVMKKVKPGLYVASSMPKYLEKLGSTSKAILSFAKANEIEIPKEASDALGEL